MAGASFDIAAATAEARRLLRIDPAAAAERARQIVGHAPNSLEASFILGAALRRAGRLDEALAVLAPLAAAHPSAWGLHYEHGMALAARGDGVAAVAALERATHANPRAWLAWHALADQHATLGQDERAVTAHRQALAAGAGDPALAEVAARWFDTEDPAAATALGDRFGLDRNDVAATRLLADLALRLDRPEAAAALLTRTVAAAPAFAPARYHLAAALHLLDRGSAAHETIAPLLASDPGVAAHHALRAAIRLQIGQEAPAIDDYAAALKLDPDNAALWHSHGHALRAVGRQAEAVAAYRHALTLAPAFGEPWWSLANLKTWRFAADDIASMQAALAGDPPPEDRACLHFALGKALEDERQYADSFAHYRRANEARRALAPHDADAHGNFIRRTIATFDAPLFAARAGAGVTAPDPIFVLGMPRSGSTLVEQILASHSAVEGASELPYVTAIARALAPRRGRERPYPEVLAELPLADFAAAGAEYLDRAAIHRRQRRAFFVDKFPGNFLHVGLIHLMLPNARIIDVRRDPRACCVSLFKQNFARGQAYSYDLADLGRYYADYVALMAHVDRVLPGRVLRVSYEALVEDAEGETRRLLDHVELAFEPACLTFHTAARAVRTPSSEQVRRPIFRDGLDQWRHFAPWLAPLERALATPSQGIDVSDR
ncbi:sulfotransferase [Sphingomonas sp. RT2P30]|uniref:tetratricopeptide repeat-containing sulfotransferase family protein n=1 Tax=Parasphingomonas halimpatiens TaxID=3096162 RepID=UPI002FC81089